MRRHQHSADDLRKRIRFEDSYSLLPCLLDHDPELGFDISHEHWLEVLGSEWPRIDNVWQYYDELMASGFGYLEGPCFEMMSTNEAQAFNNLPAELTIYRGCHAANKWGFSWTLSKDVASRFPFLNRYHMPNTQPLLVSARVSKKDVIAYKLDRNEWEIIIKPRPPRRRGGAVTPRLPIHISTVHLTTFSEAVAKEVT